MSRQYPSTSEFRRDSPRCGGDYIGCAIVTLEDLLIRYKKNGRGTYDQGTLAASASRRHRRAEPGNRHGICPNRYCGYCVTLELRARGVPCSWVGLSERQFKAKARAGYPMSVSIRYGYIHRVSKASYSRTMPARGRSDSFTGAHQVVVWWVAVRHASGRFTYGPRADGTFTHYVVSDPDFGSSSRPVVPPYSLIERDELERARAALHTSSGKLYGVCVLDRRPPKLT